MATTISTAARNAACDAITLLLNAGGAGVIEIYQGTQPAGPDSGIGVSTLLAEVPLAADAFGDALAGVATAAGTPLEDASANAQGTAQWFRRRPWRGTAVFDGSVGTAAPADLILNTTSIEIDGPVRITSFTFTIPASE